MIKRFFCLLVCLIITFSCVSVPASAEGDFYWKENDKAYITFIFDDSNMPFTQIVYDMFSSYNMPMCCAVVSSVVSKDEEILALLRQIEKSGGEILSHCYNHVPIEAHNSTVKNIEQQFGVSYKTLTKLGFNINGIIETGNGGGEKTANYELMEPIVRKYYKYSNAYGTSAQYKGNNGRNWLFDYNASTAKKRVDKAVERKEWLWFSAHDFDDFPEECFKELLQYIDSLGKDKVEVVTYNYMYNNFGVYSGPKIPTQEVLDQIAYEMQFEQGTSSTSSENNTSSKEQSSSSSVSSVITSATQSEMEEELIGMDDVDFSNASESTSGSVSSTSQQVDNDADEQNEKKNNNKIIIVSIAVGAVALLLIGAAVFVVLKFKK